MCMNAVSRFPTSERGVDNEAGVGDHLLALVELHSHESAERAMNEFPTIRHVRLPPDVTRVFPQHPRLSGNVSRVPQSVAENFAGT